MEHPAVGLEDDVGVGAQPKRRPAFLCFGAAEALDRLNAWAGSDVALPSRNGAQRQRALIEAGATPAEVYEACVRETQATYVEETADEPA